MKLGYEDNMVNTSELFHLWVIEGPKAILDEIPFDKTNLNIIVTDNLEMYRTRKVRILNGAHTSMTPYALLSGLDTVKSCMEDEKMSAFLRKCVFEEIIPTLDLPKEDVVLALDAITEPVSLFEPVYHDGGEAIYVMDQVRDSKNTDENWLRDIAVKEALKHITDREKHILNLRFFQGKTQMEVAEEIGISQAQVSRLEKTALSHMRKYV